MLAVAVWVLCNPFVLLAFVRPIDYLETNGSCQSYLSLRLDIVVFEIDVILPVTVRMHFKLLYDDANSCK